ncbi:sensor histidine kinase [Larkinella ripae]
MEYAAKSDYERAIKHSLMTLSFSEKTKNNGLIGAVYSLLISIYSDIKDFRLQLFYINQYLRFAERWKIPFDVCNAYLLKAELYERQGQYRAAWPLYQKALEITYTYTSDKVYYLTEVIRAMESNLRHRGKYRRGQVLVQQAIRLNEQTQDLQGLANLWKALAENYQCQRLSAQSLQAATKALDYAHRSTIPSILLNVLPTAIAVQEANGQHRQALVNQKAYMALKDSLLNQEKNERIAHIQAQYELETKEQTIQLLNKNVQLQRLKADEQDQQRFVLLQGIGALVFLVGVTGFFLRRSYLTQQLLSQQKGAIETQTTQLAEANRLKDRLFSIIGHDLRSPVASLKSSLMLSRSHAGVTDRVKLDGLEREVNNLHHTLDNILYWSLSQQNGLRALILPVNLTDVVADVLEGFEGFIRQRRLNVSFDEPPVEVRMDENLTVLVLRNILHNAIKFTPIDGRIDLRIHHQPTTVELTIADTGTGMDVADHNPQTHKEGQGTGLGLTLSEELMKRNGGSLRLKSTIGQGTTVTLSWPANSQ